MNESNGRPGRAYQVDGHEINVDCVGTVAFGETADEREQQRRDVAEDAVRAAFRPEVAEAVVACEAFEALAWKLHRAAEGGCDPETLLAEIDKWDVAWTVNAQAPAAFIASRIDF